MKDPRIWSDWRAKALTIVAFCVTGAAIVAGVAGVIFGGWGITR